MSGARQCTNIFVKKPRWFAMLVAILKDFIEGLEVGWGRFRRALMLIKCGEGETSAA